MKQDIKLNLVQRAILINQNRILNILQAEQHGDDTDTKADRDDVISILENGFEDHYDEVLPDPDMAYSDPVQSEVSTFVRELVNAYDHLAHFYLEHSKELEEYKSEFSDFGFDANDEGDEGTSGHYAYLDWFVNKKSREII